MTISLGKEKVSKIILIEFGVKEFSTGGMEISKNLISFFNRS